MLSLNQKERVNKLLSVLFIYALLIHEIVPFASASQQSRTKYYGALAFNNTTNDHFSEKDISKDVNVEGNERIDVINASDLMQANPGVYQASGPGQTESTGFSLGSTDGMVNKFTGDFNHSIPLMNVEGYPIVINYNSNIGMNQEASWVGLGWDLNIGSISREMRGLPDEFNGDQSIIKTVNQNNNTTVEGWKVGTNVAYGFEFEKEKQVNTKLGGAITLLGGGYHNTFTGYGNTFDADINLSATKGLGEHMYFGGKFGLGFDFDSKNGLGRSTSFGLSVGNENANKDGWGIGPTYARNYNSRSGLVSQTIGWGANGSFGDNTIDIGAGATLKYGSLTSTPRINYNGLGESSYNDYKAFIKFSLGKGSMTVSGLGANYNSDNGLNYGENFTEQIFIQPAFGYLHSGKRNKYDGVDYPIMDFNRSNDFNYSEEMKNLAFSFQTYDIFRASALGMSGTFRAQRNDVGTYKDPTAENHMDGHSNSFNAGLLASEGKIQIGYARGDQDGGGKSGNWIRNEGNVLEFVGEDLGNSYDEATYFKMLGEATPTDLGIYEELEGSSASYVDVNKVGGSIVLDNYLKTGNGGANIDGQVINGLNGRPVISNVFTPIIAADLTGSNSLFFSRHEGQFIFSNVSAALRMNSSYRKANHISSVEIISNGGMNYTYGIPTYTIENNEVSFSVDGDDVDINSDNLVRYYTGDNITDYGDNSINNIKGRGHSFDKTTTPGYAHAFLLTEMKSSNYVDVLGDGLTVDDVGSYYKFNHTQVYGNEAKDEFDELIGNYKWRFPMSDDQGSQAMYNRGLEGTDLDNMAHYSYGEKEIWYTHSVESKNFIAEFYLEDRDDGYGVLDEDGQIDTDKPLRLLKKIVLYNRAERINNGEDAIPLQTVEFFYDYSLCKGNPSNSNSHGTSPIFAKSGKLTLKEIRVSKGNSEETSLSHYNFVYNSGALNPNFSYANMDAWGNYKPNDVNKPNHIFPYSEQDESIANDNINSWKLIAIDNPMGGRTEIDYEADRYVSVQDKRTMRHFDIHGMTNLIEFLHLQNQPSWDGADLVTNEFRKDFSNAGLDAFFNTHYSGVNVYSFVQAAFARDGYTQYSEEFGIFHEKFVPNNVIVFKLDQPLDVSTYNSDKLLAGQAVKDLYFKTGDPSQPYMKDMLFKTHVFVKEILDKDGVFVEEVFEYIPAFAEISKDYVDPFGNLLPYSDNFNAIGVMPEENGEYKYGYVVLNPANSGSRELKNDEGNDKNGVLLNPIQRNALDFVRQNLPDKVYGSCEDCAPDLSIDRKAFFGKDMYQYMIDDGAYVPSIVDDHSTMRMYIPGDVKFGGNARVSKITYHDNWDVLSGEYLSSYSWSYKYPDRTQESGVASYEPRSIIDESPFYYWDTYVNSKKKFPDETKFTPTPITSALFPIPVIGYADVRVQFSGGTTMGYSKSEYYTSADFPTIERVTDIEKSVVDRFNPIAGTSTELYGFTQGFFIETNDFHGQPKEFSVYKNLGVNSILQSRSTYIYNKLDEKVNTINRHGSVSKENIAMEYDIHSDSRFSTNYSISSNFGLDFRFTIVGFAPISFSPVLNLTQRSEGFYSHTLVKHINRSAVVKRIETEYLNSINTAQNLMYDRYTGSVVLSSLQDEYEDELYSLSYPSHWYEEELRDVYSTINAPQSLSVLGSALDLSAATVGVFSPGDQITLTDINSNVGTAVILDIDGLTATLITDAGVLYNGLSGAVVVVIDKTGRKNRLLESMQSVVTKTELAVIPETDFDFPDMDNLGVEAEIISGSAMNYRNRSNIRCGDGNGFEKPNSEILEGAIFNPYDFGIMGDLVLDGQFAWQSPLLDQSFNHGTRFEGVYNEFIPYYRLDASKIWRSIEDDDYPNGDGTIQNWRKLGEVARYDEFGKPIESLDQIHISSSVLYGFNKELGLLPSAQAVNAKQREIAFDGFEDYNYFQNAAQNYQETHFDFKQALSSDVRINETVRHSGLASLEIDPGFSAQVAKDVSIDCAVPGDGIIPSGSNTTEIKAENCLCIIPFEPSVGKYIVGAWVKVGDDKTLLDYSDAYIDVIIDGVPLPLPIKSSGPILDGWQRMEGEFEIPANALTISIKLVNNSASDQVYFDDLRIHPFLAGMTTVVYDPATLLPLATHDGYNSTTFYNYDENLNQVRVRVETIDGIKTVVETEFGGQKSFTPITE